MAEPLQALKLAVDEEIALGLGRRRVRLRTTAPDLLAVRNSDGSAAGQVAFRIENRTDDPADPEVGRIWLRIDL